MALTDAERLNMITIALMKHSTVTAGGWPPPALSPATYGGVNPFSIEPVFVPGYAQDKLFLIISSNDQDTFTELKAGETLNFSSGSYRILAFYLWNGALSRAFVGLYNSGISDADVITLLRAYLPTAQRVRTQISDTHSIFIAPHEKTVFQDSILLSKCTLPTTQYTEMSITDDWAWVTT